MTGNADPGADLPPEARITPEREVPAKPIGRRVFLGLVGLGAVGIAIGDRASNPVN